MYRHTGFPARRRVFVAAVGLVLLIGSGTGAAELGSQPAPDGSEQTASALEGVDDHTATGEEPTHDGSNHDTGSTHDGAPSHDTGTTHDDGTTHDGAPSHDTGTTHDDGSTHDGGPSHDTGSTHDDSQHGGSQGGQAAKLACAEIDPSWSEVTLTGHPISGHYEITDGRRTVEFFVYDSPAGGKLVNWSSDAPLSAVIMRSGQDAATYEYEPPATSGAGLQPPLVDRDGRNLAAVLGCYQPEPVEVGIDLYLSDSTDPVEVGSQFAYVIDLSASDYLNGSTVVLTLAPQVTAVEVGDCTLSDHQVHCTPPMDEAMSWATAITVEAVESGTAVTWVHFQANGDPEPVSASALEVTRIVGARGHGGGCGGHEEGGDDHTSGSEHDDGGDDHTSGSEHDDGECGSDQHGMIAACTAIDPAAQTLVLQGPFASRRYQLTGPGDVTIWVEVGETTGSQTASWQSNVPVGAVIARTGKQLEIYRSQPAALAGSGVVGPMSGSGPRPMADIAFCVVDPPVVGGQPSASTPPTTIYDTVVPPFDPPRLEPPPAVLSAELEAESVVDETEVASETAPPAPVTPELTSLPFTGPADFALLTRVGMWMLTMGSLVLAAMTLLEHQAQGGHRRRIGREESAVT